MNKRDYYEVLGVSKDASEAEIKGFSRTMQAQGNSRLEVAEAVEMIGGFADG